MTEEEFLSALPPPGEPERSLVLPDFAAHQLAERCWAMCWVTGGATGVVGRSTGLIRSFKGGLTEKGAAHLAQLQQAGSPA